MKTHHCRRKKRRGEESGRGLCEKWWGRWMVFIGREG